MAQENNRKLMVACRDGVMDGEQGAKFLANDIVKYSGDLNFAEKPFYRTALWEAAVRDQIGCVRFLLDKDSAEKVGEGCSKGKVDVNQGDHMGRTPLHEACYYGHLECAKVLSEVYGADVNAKDSCGQTPLFRAIEGDRTEVIRWLVGKAAPVSGDGSKAEGKNTVKVNCVDKWGLTPQHYSAFRGGGAESWFLYTHGSWKNRWGVEGEAAPAKPAPAAAAAAAKDDANKENAGGEKK